MTIALLAIAFTVDYHRVVDYMFSDEAVYYMMAESLAFDQDLEYTQEDLQRVYKEGWHAGPQGIFLTKTGGGKIYYSKSLVYALFLAPFLRVLGFQGFLVLNSLLLSLMIWMGWVYLRQFNDRLLSLLVALTFFLLSASFVYTFWITPETFNMCCITAGLFLWLYRREERLEPSSPGRSRLAWLRWLFTTPDGRLYLAPIPIAIACASKLPNLLFLFPMLADTFIGGIRFPQAGGARKFSIIPNISTWRKLVILCCIFVVFVGILYGLQHTFTGHFNPYAGDRKTFYWDFPLASGRDVWEQGVRLSNEDYIKESFYFNQKTLFYNIYYYVFGRFTGMLPYFFCSFLAFYYFLRQSLRTSRSPVQKRQRLRRLLLLLTIGGSIGAYIIMAPSNYQGGGGAFGNRFFLNIYPAFLFLIITISSARPLFISWAVGTAFLAQALLNPFQSSYYPAAQAFRFPYRLLPVELTLIDTIPTNVNHHLMQTADQSEPPYRVYFVDENISDLSPYDFWVKGEDSAEMVLRTEQPQQHLVIRLTNGPIPNQVDVSVAKQRQSIRLDLPGEQRQLIFPLEWSMPYFRSHLYPLTIRSHTGFVPKFTPNSPLQDTRYLGCRVSFALDSLAVARAYLEHGEPQEAIRILEPETRTDPKNIRTRYYLGHAYQQAGMLEASLEQFEQGQRLLPVFQDTFRASCTSLDKACTFLASPTLEKQAPIADFSTWLHSITRRFEAEDSRRTTGKVIESEGASQGKAVLFIPGQHPPARLVYGQDAKLPAGHYQAKYLVKVDNTSSTTIPSGAVACYTDIYHRKRGVLVQDTIFVADSTYSQSEGYREYTLNFEITRPLTLEFRVRTTGSAAVEVDWIDVYPRLPLQLYQALSASKQLQGDHEDLLHDLQETFDVDPWSSDLQRQLLETLLQTGQWEQALALSKNSGKFSDMHTGFATYLLESISKISKTQVLPESVVQFSQNLSAKFLPEISSYHAFEDKLALLGYSLSTDTIAPGAHFTIGYYWKSLDRLEKNYTIFVHFTKQGKRLPEPFAKIARKFTSTADMFQQDHEPLNGRYPTSHWIPHELIHEQYDVPVPANLEPGRYEIWLGVWNPFTGTRLESNGNRKVKIGTLDIS